MSAPFVYKTYRCVWSTECYTVDQYGMRDAQKPYYVRDCPTREEALNHLGGVAHYVDPPGRWVPDEAPHSYVEAGVIYHERLVS